MGPNTHDGGFAYQVALGSFDAAKDVDAAIHNQLIGQDMRTYLQYASIRLPMSIASGASVLQ